MIFSEVETFLIPDGKVKRVFSDDKILWETSLPPSWYKCKPVISITYESKNPTAGTNTYGCQFSCSISGITRALISKVTIIRKYYRDTVTGTSIPQSISYSETLPNSVNTESKYSFASYVSYSVPSALYYGHSFALQITYTDLNGDEKTLTTNYISSVGLTAKASA